MGVKKIFTVLITIVACVLIGALVLNVLLPNVTAQVINAAEDMVYRATGLTFDFNGDGNVGDGGSKGDIFAPGGSDDVSGDVEGFK